MRAELDSSLFTRLVRVARPVYHKVRNRGLTPGPAAKHALAVATHAGLIVREALEWSHGALVATPFFLSMCAVHGEEVMVDRVPYVYGRCRLEVGSRIRVSGTISIIGSVRGDPVLRIGDGTYIGHGSSFGIAQRIEIGRFVAVGSDTHIADTTGHSHRRLDTPIWMDPAEDRDVAPVVIEDNVHIGGRCIILKGVRIGARSVIGAGTVVRASVPPDSIVIGNPGRVAGFRAVAQATASNTGESHTLDATS